MSRAELLKELADIILSKHTDHPLRVGIDGVDGSGKSTLGDELAQELKDSGRQIIRTSIDRFHNPRSIRYQKGPESPEGYYFDSFNYADVISHVLEPLGPAGSLRIQTSAFDYRTDTPINILDEVAEREAILLFDGVFIFRPEIAAYWDLKIYVDVDFAYSVERAVARDLRFGGTEAEIRHKYETKYVPGQKLYIQTVHPRDKADVVVDNNSLDEPLITLQ